jgi:DHA2 family methylenomycin A resistance protein-like MFS transporter
MLSAASISDVVGSLWIFQLGIIIFGIASAGCGLSATAESLIIFRVIQGIGAATMLPSSLAVLNQSFALTRQPSRSIYLPVKFLNHTSRVNR